MTRSLESKRAHGSRCRRCRRPVLRGRDEGLDAVVDVTPVDRAGEVAALLDRRWTFSLLPGSWLVHRDQDRIRTLGGTIHVEHQC